MLSTIDISRNRWCNLEIANFYTLDIFQNILNHGHSIGNHTYDHLKGCKASTKAYLASAQLADSIISSKFQNPKISDSYKASLPKLFRPPYGKFKAKQSKKLQLLGYKIILWDVLSYDWDKTVSEEVCLKNVISAAKEGSIIVFHDSIKASENLKYALPKVLQYYSEKGYEFKALSKRILE